MVKEERDLHGCETQHKPCDFPVLYSSTVRIYETCSECTGQSLRNEHRAAVCHISLSSRWTLCHREGVNNMIYFQPANIMALCY